MKVAIFGCRDGVYLYEQVELNGKDKYDVRYFCDNNPQYHNKVISGIPVLDGNAIVEKYTRKEIDAVIIAVRKGYSRYCIIDQLKKEGIDNIILLMPGALTYRTPILFDEQKSNYNKQWMVLETQNKPIIQHLEAHVADGCNLNCRGCLHFANLYDKNEFPDLTKLLKDLRRISENCEVFQFRVLGGEPLLNPDLTEFLIELRKIFPKTDLAVISNGILIPKMKRELFDIMREQQIGFNLTLYPPTLKLKDKIYSILEKYHVKYGSHESKTEEFEKYLILHPVEKAVFSHKYCVSRGILTLRDGKLYKCPVSTYVNRFFETFMIQQQYDDGVDIYNNRLEWEVLIRKLTLQEGQFCKHCSCEPEQFQWKTGVPECSDWLVNKEVIL